MTDLKSALETLGWTQQYLGEQVGKDPRQVRRWLEGARIPDDISAWIAARLALHAATKFNSSGT